MNILEAVDDPNIFRRWFRNPATYAAWRAFLAALFGLPMSEEQRAIYTACTGRQDAPGEPYNEAWLVCGRRSGKSFIVALISVYLATLKDWTPYLSPGERGTILVLASDKRQARTIMRYASALISEVALLAPLVERTTAEEIELSNRVSIEITSASFRSVRGYTVLAACCDEISFWRLEETSANPDVAILDALRPAMATVPGAMLLCASSPYSRKGAMWDAYRRWHGKPDAPVLVWQSPTKVMNPTVPQRVIDAAYERDPESASAEFGANFRADLADFVSRAAVDACTIAGRYELPPVARVAYKAFCDPSGGSSDSMTLAIGHREADRAVLDCVREVRAPFAPDAVCAEFSATLKSYGLRSVQGDKYASMWPVERFAAHGVKYEPAERTKSELYLALLPGLNSAAVELLDLPRLSQQLCGLERRSARGGRDSVDHAVGQKDDLANAVAGCLVMLGTGRAALSPLERFKALAGGDTDTTALRANIFYPDGVPRR